MEYTEFESKLRRYGEPRMLPASVDAINRDLTAGLDTNGYWDRLSPEQKNFYLTKLLDERDPNVPRDDWLPLVAAAARSGAPNRHNVCREWSKRSPRFDPGKFESEFSSFERDHGGGITIGTLLHRASEALKAEILTAAGTTIVPGRQVVAMSVAAATSISSLPTAMRDPAAIDLINSVLGITEDWAGQPTLFMLVNGKLAPCKEKEAQLLLANKFVALADGNLVAAYTYFKRHPLRRTVARVGYFPLAPQRSDTLNLWRGFGVEPVAGDCRKMVHHIRDVWCSGDRTVLKYVLSWLAHMVQKPGETPRTALVVKSAREGTGKSLVLEWLARMMGAHALLLNTAAQLLGRFNDFLEAVTFVGINEPEFAGNHEDARKLKSIVADSRIPIERKFGAVSAIPNALHIIMTSNDDWTVRAGHGARRFCVMEASPHRAGDYKYFRELSEEASNGGLEALLQMLRRIDISGFDPVRDMPKTAALRDQQLRSVPPHVQWALDLAEGLLPPDPPIPIACGQACATRDLCASYTVYARKHGSRAMGGSAFGRWLATLGLTATRVGGARDKGWQIPDAPTFAALIEKSAGIHP